MNKFTSIAENICNESADSGQILKSEVTRYINKVNKSLPKGVKDAIFICQKYNIIDPNDILSIRDSSKQQAANMAQKFGMTSDTILELRQILKDLKSSIKLMPHMQTKQERTEIELGRMSMDDLTIDLKTPQGRNAASKMYMPMVYKIVNQYVGRSSLSKQDLISAALIGFTNAMNNWRRGEDDGQKYVSFKTYAGYMVRHQILDDINRYSHSFSGTNWYANKVYGASLLTAASLESGMKDDNGEYREFRMNNYKEEPDYNLNRDEKKHWNQLYKMLSDKFKARDIDIFYRYFGLNGYKREKSKDIAKSYGMSEGNIRNSIINKIIKFLKNDMNAAEILTNIQDLYNESLMVEMVGFDKDMICETLLNDDTFIFLEELNKWNNKNIFINTYDNAVKGMDKGSAYAIDALMNGDYEYADSRLKKDKDVIMDFLRRMYPADTFAGQTDITILDRIEELQNAYKKFNR